ncbi:MAG: hypothetical protein A2017_00585 [Lentisphaerae bacterium GWF2_44_16]|nr:MAG: hypothetical protein A2017_00585 [Lentisphaerae bacterium GWF2_44_16]
MKIRIYGKNAKYLGELNSARKGPNLFETCRIDKEILNKAESELSIKCEIPILNMHGFWSPDMFRPRMKLDWRIDFSCAAHRNFPYLSFFSQDQRNCATVGTANLMDDALVAAAMNQQNGTYDVSIVVSISDKTEEFEIFLDFSERPWPEIMHDYRKLVRPDWKPSYPEAAWLPVYCTWYAVHAAVEKRWLDEHVDAAAAMGFGTFIVDDGWCFDDMKRVKPETIGSWYERIGDWQVSEKKLPDFKAHVERAQKLGLKYLLWVSPFMVGMKSKFYAETECDYLTEEDEGYRVFDPVNEEAVRKSMKYMLDLVSDYGLDGLKIDFVDAVPQFPEKPRGKAVFNYISTLLNTIKKENPAALFEFRQRYSTPIMLDQATQFRAGDVPFDFIENLHRIAQIRICAGDKVPVHADPVYWHPSEAAVNVARHMICSLAGVPMVSMDLNELPEEQRVIIKYWLGFYKEHLAAFQNGHWQVEYEFDHLKYITVSYETEKIIFLCDAKHGTEAIDDFHGSLYLLNISNEAVSMNCHSVQDCRGATVGKDVIPMAGQGMVVI